MSGNAAWPDRPTYRDALACMAALVDQYNDDRAKCVHVKLKPCPACDGKDDECKACEGSGEVVDERSLR